MKTIIISGPSGSGKSALTNKLLNLFDDSIVIKTDSYYRDNILIRFLSIFKFDIYDRPLSIKENELNKTLISIYNKERLITIYHYDFKRKQSSQSKKEINYNGENQFLIVEGIFSHRLELNYQKTINILCEEKKEICFKRRLKRDQLYRGRNIREVNKKFNKSWFLFYKHINNYINRNKVMVLDPVNKISYDKLILNLQKKITKKNN
tara:strand:- start:137 stop:757 length:621 start_codon:yes stop_codon:yes gene_type:complete